MVVSSSYRVVLKRRHWARGMMTFPLRYRAPRGRSRSNNFKMFQLSLIESKILLNSEIPEKMAKGYYKNNNLNGCYILPLMVMIMFFLVNSKLIPTLHKLHESNLSFFLLASLMKKSLFYFIIILKLFFL